MYENHSTLYSNKFEHEIEPVFIDTTSGKTHDGKKVMQVQTGSIQ